MHVYEVWICSAKYHGKSGLTYASPVPLAVGTVVEVSMRSTLYHAIIYRQVKTKPTFKLKEVERSFNVVLPSQSLQLLEWLIDYYPAPLGTIASLFVPTSLRENKDSSFEYDEIKIDSLPLTSEQKKILNALRGQANPQSILLHGNTGSGKTRIYVELALEAISKGKSTLILTPEIGLTPQLTQVFTKIFGNRVVVIHSRITAVQRRNIWQQIANSTEPIVVIGARSALFAPFQNLGLVVVDEAHDNSYKQGQAPYYLGTRVAAKLASLHKCLCIFGTATPLVADYYVFETKKSPLLRMEQAARGSVQAPKVQVIDLKDKEQFIRSRILSESLLGSIERALRNGKQALVFLNRRGTARIVLCENCGWQALCPHCDIPLTYHQDHHELRCHICNFAQNAPTQCPDCQHTDIAFKSIGTKAVFGEVVRLFPEAITKRFDGDTPEIDRLEKQYEDILEGKVDILVGTQLVTKGLDLPRLASVGIVAADSSLYLPDFTSEEQTYQILTQVIGRVGRTDQPTDVTIQTFSPNSTILKAVVERNWQAFYESQLQERKTFAFPPFCHLLQLSISKSSLENTQKAAQTLAKKLKTMKLPLEILGPSPSFYEKSRGKYHWQIIIKSKNRQNLTEVIKVLPADWRYNLDPINLL